MIFSDNPISQLISQLAHLFSIDRQGTEVRNILKSCGVFFANRQVGIKSSPLYSC
jgi:hypothetical protein